MRCVRSLPPRQVHRLRRSRPRALARARPIGPLPLRRAEVFCGTCLWHSDVHLTWEALARCCSTNVAKLRIQSPPRHASDCSCAGSMQGSACARSFAKCCGTMPGARTTVRHRSFPWANACASKEQQMLQLFLTRLQRRVVCNGWSSNGRPAVGHFGSALRCGALWMTTVVCGRSTEP